MAGLPLLRADARLSAISMGEPALQLREQRGFGPGLDGPRLFRIDAEQLLATGNIACLDRRATRLSQDAAFDRDRRSGKKVGQHPSFLVVGGESEQHGLGAPSAATLIATFAAPPGMLFKAVLRSTGIGASGEMRSTAP